MASRFFKPKLYPFHTLHRCLQLKNDVFEYKGEVFNRKFKNQKFPLPISEKSTTYDPREMKFVNHVMKNGEKTVAYAFYQEILKELEPLIPAKLSAEKKDPKAFLFAALDRLKPVIEVRTIKGAHFDKKIPVALSAQRARFMATKILMTSLFDKDAKWNAKKVARELVEAYQEKGVAYAKKIKIHKKAEGSKIARQ